MICLPNHHPVKVAAEVAQFDHMSRGRFMLGIGVGGLFSDFELFGNADRGVRARKAMESIGMIQRIWAQDPPYDLRRRVLDGAGSRTPIIPELGIGYMPKPFQQGRTRRSRCRWRAATRRPRASPPSAAGASSPATMCRANALGSHWQIYSKACAEAGMPARGDNWRVARNVMVAPSEAEARDRVFSEQGSNRYFYTYMREVLSRVGLLSALKPARTCRTTKPPSTPSPKAA